MINYKIIFLEDFIITFFIFTFAKRFKKINKKIFFHFINKESASEDYENNSEYYLSIIFAGNIFYDFFFYSYPKDIEIIMNYIVFTAKHFKKAKILYNSFFNYFFGKILSNIYLSSKNKIYLEKTFQINLGLFEQLNISQELFSEESQIQTKRNNNKIIKISVIIVFSNHENLRNIIKEKDLINLSIKNLNIKIFYYNFLSILFIFIY
jgi:hypothetical protein